MYFLSIWRAEIKLKTHLLFYSEWQTSHTSVLNPSKKSRIRYSACLLVALNDLTCVTRLEILCVCHLKWRATWHVLDFIYGFREHMHVFPVPRVWCTDEEAIHQARWDTAGLTCFPNSCWLQSTWPVHCIYVTWMYDSPEAVRHCHHHGALDIFMYLWLY